MGSLSHNRNRRYQTPSPNSGGISDSHTPLEVCLPHSSPAYQSWIKERFDANSLTSEGKWKPLSIRIFDSMIPRSLVNPQNLEIYGGIGDPHEHAKHVDNNLDYYHVHRVVKSNFFC